MGLSPLVSYKKVNATAAYVYDYTYSVMTNITPFD